MEKQKKQRTINKLLTLMLAFVMVFTGMGIGSWGVDTAWADDDFLDNLKIKETNKTGYLEMKKLYDRYNLLTYMVHVNEGTTEIAVSGINNALVGKTYDSVPQWFTLDYVIRNEGLDPESNDYESWEELLEEEEYDSKEEWLADWGIEIDNPPWFGGKNKKFSSENYKNGEYIVPLNSDWEMSSKSFSIYYPDQTYNED